ncbi:MAG: hypothetical protein ACRDK7_12755 [Solirubrobacteraceae bacterium]
MISAAITDAVGEVIWAGRRGLVAGFSTVALTLALVFSLASPARADEVFGIESVASSITSNEAGAPAVQAGSHPNAITTSIAFNHVVTGEEEGHPRVRTYGDPRDIEVNLPQGVIIDPRATQVKCTEAELESPEGPASCPDAAAVGVVSIYLDYAEVSEEPVYNMATPVGVPAELGFNATGIGLIMHVGGRVRTGGDYGLSADISEIPDEHPIYGVKLTLWGEPSATSHNQERGLCADGEAKQIFKQTGVHGSCPVERAGTPFLTLPSSCTGDPLTTTIDADSWQRPAPVNPDGTPDLGDSRWRTATATSPSLSGCTGLAFSPKLTVGTAEPEVARAESPSGLDLDLKLPLQEGVAGVAGADPREMATMLPPGFAISPLAADGREACTPAEIGLDDAKAATCPEAATLGTAKIATPLLEGPLEGSLYLARPYENEPAFGSPAHPGGSLFALYLVAAGDGILVKLAGEVSADPTTGRLTVSWRDLPQLPIGEIALSLSGGPRALLATPATCGSYTVQTTLTPWSGAPAARQVSTIEIDSGPGGGPCPSGLFGPALEAGTTNNQAGSPSPFTLTLSRQDGEQRFGAFAVKLPAGLSARLGGVALCPEPQASLGDCPAASEIGAATVGVGPGPDPFYLPEPGRQASGIYLTGPTPPEGSNPAGTPFGLSIVLPALAGPFDLGTVVVRASIAIDPRSAKLTISSGPGVGAGAGAGAGAGVGGIPTIKDGIPLDIRTLNLKIDRPGFIVNPTGCTPRSVVATIFSVAGTEASASSPFQAADCAGLPFRPRLTALTHARASKADGAYLHVKIVSAPGQTDIGKVKIDLPKQFPLRSTTLQKACVASVFAPDPAACPPASIVGTATIVTPLLAGALSGPVYLVSHGMAASPALALVLQGDGLWIELEGQTKIHDGIASGAFRSLPDLPLGTLDVVFPTGPHSIFAAPLPARAKGGLCAQTLRMPTAITGQNGVPLKRTTRIGITGCPPARTKVKPAGQRKHAGRAGRGRAKRGRRAGRGRAKRGRRAGRAGGDGGRR